MGPFVLVVSFAFVVLDQLLILGYIVDENGRHNELVVWCWRF